MSFSNALDALQLYIFSEAAALFTPAAITAKNMFGRNDLAYMATLGSEGAITTSFFLLFKVLMISVVASSGETPSGFLVYNTTETERRDKMSHDTHVYILYSMCIILNNVFISRFQVNIDTSRFLLGEFLWICCDIIKWQKSSWLVLSFTFWVKAVCISSFTSTKLT